MANPELSTNVTSLAFEGSTVVPIYIRLSSAAPIGGLAVSYLVQGSVLATDYQLAAGDGVTDLTASTFKVSAGATVATLLVTPTADTVVEVRESLRLVIQTGTGYTVAEPGFSFAQTPTSFPTATSAPFVAVGDVNGDRLLDVIAVNEDARRVTVLSGNGDGSFGAGVQIAVPGIPVDALIGDFNRDGYGDVAVPLASTDNLVIAMGSAGGLGSWTSYAVGDAPRYSTLGDFNGDGRQDIAVANLLSDNISILLGRADGTFESARNFASGVGVHQPVAVDVNRDGRQDLVVADYDAAKVLVHVANADGSLAAAVGYNAGSGTQGITSGDFNGDGIVDIAAANSLSGSVSVFLGNGTGGLGQRQR